jgi:hypothetical protein
MIKLMIFVLQEKVTTTEEGGAGGGDLVYLDRLQVSCYNGAISLFKLERLPDDKVCKRPSFLLLLRPVGVACARMPPDSRAKPLRV